MTEKEVPELMSSHRHTQTTATYETTLSEDKLKTSRTALLQLRV